MKRIILPAIATFATILSTGAANAQSVLGLDLSKGNYIEGNVGSAFTGDTHVRGAASTAKGNVGGSPDTFGSALLGHELGRGFAVEAEGVYAQTGLGLRGSNGLLTPGTDRTVQTYGGVVNLRYSPHLGLHVGRFGLTPYVAAGVGYGGVTYTQNLVDESDNGLLWQAKTGLDVRLSPHMSLDLGYRYLNGPQFEAAHDGSSFDAVNLSSHEQIASAGLRYRF